MPEHGQTSVDDLKAFLKREAARPVRPVGPHSAQHIRLRQLDVFREAARHATLADAAVALGINRQTVVDAIAHLEHNIGDIPLLEPEARGVQLTRAGTVLFEKAGQLLQDEAAAKALAGRPRSTTPGAPHSAREGHESHLRLREVELFLEAAQQENMLAACRAMGVSTSYMSDAIAGLEETLGVVLFDRDKGGSHITQVGKLFVERGKQLLRDESAIRVAVADAGPGEAEGASETPVTARYRRSAGEILEALELIEARAPAGRELSFPASLARALTNALDEVGHAGESVDRIGAILDVMQASVTDAADIESMFEPAGRASRRFRDLHEASEREFTPEVKARAARRPRGGR